MFSDLVARVICLAKKAFPSQVLDHQTVAAKFPVLELETPSAEWFELHTFLLNMDCNDLFKLAAVVYAGRDGSLVRPEYDQCLSSFSGTEDLVRQIIGKGFPLIKYLEKGWEAARQQGIDLDAPFHRND